MPELPEVETVVRGLNRLILKKKISTLILCTFFSSPKAVLHTEILMYFTESSF